MPNIFCPLPRPQHLSGLETVRDLCCGQLENAHIGSTEINFAPGRIKGGALTADTKTAGLVGILYWMKAKNWGCCFRLLICLGPMTLAKQCRLRESWDPCVNIKEG